MNEKRIDIAVFDMDGTILNTLEDLHDAMNVILRRFDMPERTLEEVKSFVGNGIRKLIERAAPSGTSNEVIDQMLAEFLPYYQQHCDEKTKPYDGIVPLLRELRARGVKTAVVSNKADAAVQKLCEEYFPDCFDAAAGERQGVRRKPAPDLVEIVLKELQYNTDSSPLLAFRSVYIGDSDVDYATARNAGMDFIGVDWGFRGETFLRNLGAACVVKEPSEILEIICSETSRG